MLRLGLISVRQAWSNKLLCLVEILLLGLMATTLIVSGAIWESIRGSSTEFYSRIANDSDLVALSQTANGISEQTLSELRQVDNFEVTSEGSWTKAFVNGKETLVIGVDRKLEANTTLLGNITPEAGSIIVGPSVSPGNVEIIGQYDKFDISEEQIQRIATTEAGGLSSGNFVVIPEQLFEKLFNSIGPRAVLINTKAPLSSDEISRVRTRFSNTISIMTRDQFAEQGGTQTDLMNQASLGVAILSLFGVCVFLILISTSSVNAEIRSGAILKKLGVSRSQRIGVNVVSGAIRLVPALVIGTALAYPVLDSSLAALPPVILSGVPVSVRPSVPSFMIYAYLLSVSFVFIISRVIATRRAQTHPRQGVHNRGPRRRVIIIGLSVTALFLALALKSRVDVNGSLFAVEIFVGLLGTFLLYEISRLLLHSIGKAKSQSFALSARSLDNAPTGFRWQYVSHLLIVALPVASIVASGAVISRGDSLVESLLGNDFYVQTAAADAFPTEPFVRYADIDKVIRPDAVSSVVGGSLTALQIDGSDYMLQVASEGTHMPAAVNSGSEALSKLFSTPNAVILSTKASKNLRKRVGDKLDLTLSSQRESFEVVGISDYIGLNSGQLVISEDTYCRLYPKCSASYLEIQLSPSFVSISSADFQPDFLHDSGPKLHVIAAQDEYRALSTSIASIMAISLVMVALLIIALVFGAIYVQINDIRGQQRELVMLIKLGVSRRAIFFRLALPSIVCAAVSAVGGLFLAYAMYSPYLRLMENQIAVSGFGSFDLWTAAGVGILVTSTAVIMELISCHLVLKAMGRDFG